MKLGVIFKTNDLMKDKNLLVEQEKILNSKETYSTLFCGSKIDD